MSHLMPTPPKPALRLLIRSLRRAPIFLATEVLSRVLTNRWTGEFLLLFITIVAQPQEKAMRAGLSVLETPSSPTNAPSLNARAVARAETSK